MSLNPKYANLPWIAHDQPDVYEAGELPEADQAKNDIFEETALPREIECIKLSVSEAHKKFAKCKVDASNLPPDSRSVETIFERFQRIQTETNEFINDVSKLKEQINVDSKSAISPVELANMSEVLLTKLNSINIDNLNISENDSLEPTTLLQDKIIKQINDFKPEDPSTRCVGTSSHLVYEIYDHSSKSNRLEMEKLPDIDRRLQRIESLIGQPDPKKLSALTADTLQHGLLNACSRLAAKTALIQPSHLDMIETRLSGLQNKLQTITEKKEVIADFDKQNKIAELYELVKKWNTTADSLPLIVERLTALKSLHEEASEFSQYLKNVESSQSAIKENLQSYTKVLEDVQNNIKENMQIVKDNFAIFNGQPS